MRDISIKVKITVWMTMLMLGVVGVVLGFMMSISEHVIEVNSESQIKQVMDNNYYEIKIEDNELEVDDINFYTQEVTTLIYNEEGELLYGQFSAKEMPTIPMKDQVLQPITMDGVEYYVYDRVFSVEPFPKLWLRGITRVQKGSEVIDTIFILAVIILPIILLLGAMGCYIIIKKALRPMEQIVHTANQIRAKDDLSLRINLGDGKDEVHTLAETFDVMFDYLEQSFEMEKQFSSDVSHELRTPTAIILAQCETEVGESKEEYEESISLIKRQALKMSGLITSLLSLTRMDRGIVKGEFVLLDFSELCTLVCEESECLAPSGTQLLYEIEDNIMAQVDQSLMMRLLTNLIQNGFSYGKEQGYVKVLLQQDMDEIILCVEDNGIGISEENLPKIWNRFYQVNAARTARNHSTMGLGLSMVKQIVKMHGGEIQVESEVGVGTKFYIFLKNNKF